MQHSIFYYYDANAHLSSLKYPNGWEIAYAPDALGRATDVRVPSGQIFANAVTYFPNGAISGFFYGNGVKHTMTQNTRQMPSHSLDVDLDTVTGKTILDDSYVFDENGNVDYITDAAQAGLTSRDLGYDDLDRLIVADSALQWGSATYAYDPLDNIRSADQGPRQYRYNYDAANRLNDIKNPAGATQFTFTYDPQGNTTSKGAQAYVFDSANRLSQVTGVQEYRYDGLGRRVQARDVVPNQTTYWIYSQAGQVLYSAEARRSQNIYYIYLGNTQVATRAVAWGSGVETIRYQHTDSLGSPVAETDPGRVVTERNSYAPYGEAYNSIIDGTGYTGHVMDQGTGLTYMQQRYYDPQIGRFVSVDPVSTEMYSGDNFGRYKYSNDSPYVFSDPDGRREKPLNGPLGISRHVRLGSATLAYSKDSNGIDQPNRDAYNCISFTWHDSQGDPGDPANDDVFPRMDNSIVNDVMKARAEGKKLAPDEPNRPGDRVVYGTDSNGNGQLDDSELDAADIHTATVSVVDAEGNTEVVTSKEGDKEIVDHHPSDQHPSYGKFKEWYRE